MTARALRVMWTERPDVLYYPPAGPALVPVLRDVVTLLALRPWTRGLVFQFHAGGLARFYAERVSFPLAKALFRLAYFGPDAAILALTHNAADGEGFEAKRIRYIPLGVEDVAAHLLDVAGDAVPEVLCVGVVTEEKGTEVLVAACVELWDRDAEFSLSLVGACAPAFVTKLQTLAGCHRDRLRLWDVLSGDQKWRRYREATLFCFPSFHPTETFGLVCVEAMMFGLPVVAARWGATPEVVLDGETGVLVPPREPGPLAAAIGLLLDDPERRLALGRRGRERYLAHYTLDRFVQAVEDVFVEVAEGHPR